MKGVDGTLVEGEEARQKAKKDRRKFLETQWVEDENVIQIVVYEYRDARLDNREGFLALAGC